MLVSYKVKVPYRNAAQSASGPKKRNLREDTADDQPVDPWEVRSVLAVFLVSGFCAMACEVIWTRLLGLVVGPTTYSFTIVLVTFITGLALGSMIFGYFADKVKKVLWLLLFTQIAAALLVLAVSQLLGSSQLFFAKLIFTFKDQFGLLSLLKFGILFLFMILPTLCFGATFPLVGKIYTRSVSKVGKSIGFAYMFNTVGSLAGSFCAGFLLIPLVGKEAGMGAIVSLQLVFALVIAGIMLKNRKGSFLQFSGLAVPALAGIILCFSYPAWNHQQLSSGKYHRFGGIKASIFHTGWLESLFQGSKILSRSDSGELVYYGDGIGGFTTVIKRYDALGNIIYYMANSGKTDASSRGDMHTQTLSAHFPMLFHQDPKTVAVIGLASGITAGEVLYYPVDQLDILEINDQVIAASDFFIPWNNSVLSDPKTNLIIQDARAHLQLTRQKYDVIISEPSNPWMAGLAALFTIDFFNLAKDRLNNGGIFVQWMHSYQMDWKTFDLVGRTFAEVFPNSLLVVTDPSGNGSDYLLIGFKGKDRLKLEYAKQKMTSVGKSENVSLPKPGLLFRLIVSEDLPRFFGHGEVNTDNHPRLEFIAPKLMHGDDDIISKNIRSKERISLSSEIRNITEKMTANVDDQISFAAFALSVYSPFSDMVDLSQATSPQKERFFKLVKRYCSDNEIDDSILIAEVLEEDELFRKCVSMQIDNIRNKITLLPDKSVANIYLGNLYNLSGNVPEAISHFKEVLKYDPYSISTHNNLGIALASKGRFDEAINHYSIALRLDHQHTKAHNGIGIALAGQGRFDEAINHFSKALQIDPAYDKTHYNLGITLTKQGRDDDAIAHFIKALQINPDYLPAHYRLGLALAKQGRLDEAITHYSIVLRLDHEHSEAHSDIGIALAKQGRFDEAINHFFEDSRINPGQEKAHYNLGLTMAMDDRLDDAIIHFSKVLQINPEHLDALYNLGLVLGKKGRLAAAAGHFSAVLRINPGYTKAHYSLGHVMVKMGKLDKAINHFSEAVRASPGFAEVHYDLGIVLARLGRFEDAGIHFREVLRIKPGNVQAKNSLKRLTEIQKQSGGPDS
ncbi:MAG: fused MFS/spermidine synthase [Deltaproteobacteria bacterium]|nr:fused MFS/spermidine synthase [Deltaproteobacteria bacterium]MBT4642838.1 fused MFS/spermidine synthase [Deltaproteobacteria bacterium]MBT6615071.1 fused MFS/spermidine synthase [Deltaproteobacteria bacterium]